MSQAFDRIIQEPEEIVIREVCDKIENEEWNKLSEKMNAEVDGYLDKTKLLETKLDGNVENNLLMKKIAKYGNNEKMNNEILKKCEILKEFCVDKCDAQFLRKKLNAQKQINQRISRNYDNLCDDLERMKQIYSDLNNECIVKQETINHLKECETNESLTCLQNKIFENEEKFIIEQRRNNQWKDDMNKENMMTDKLENDIKICEKDLKELNDDLEISNKYQQEMEEIASTLLFIKGITGIQINKMTSSKIQFIIMKWISFDMEYNYQTKQVYNIHFDKHPSPKLKDKFSQYLLNMVHSIKNKLEITTKIKTLLDLKIYIWDIIELIKGIAELRMSINVISTTFNNQYNIVIQPLKIQSNNNNNKNNENVSIQLSISKDIQYDDVRQIKILKMKSRLLIDCILTLGLGYPFNKLQPKICVVLNRQIYDENVEKFKSINDRIEQMMVEQKLCAMFENKLSNIKLGTNLLIRCVNLIKDEMDDILKNEANLRHDIYK